MHKPNRSGFRSMADSSCITENAQMRNWLSSPVKPSKGWRLSLRLLRQLPRRYAAGRTWRWFSTLKERLSTYGVPKNGVSYFKHLLKPQSLPHHYWVLESLLPLLRQRTRDSPGASQPGDRAKQRQCPTLQRSPQHALIRAVCARQSSHVLHAILRRQSPNLMQLRQWCFPCIPIERLNHVHGTQ